VAGDERRLAARRHLGGELRSRREMRGLSGQQLADQLGWSQAKVSRIEGARTRADISDVAALLEALDVPTAERAGLLEVAETAAGPASNWRNSRRVGLTRRQQDFIDSEAAATRIRHYQPVILPGYLQTAEYARIVIELAGTGTRATRRSRS
jgi:transcriptional regulator with XRE-family HTH domain